MLDPTAGSRPLLQPMNAPPWLRLIDDDAVLDTDVLARPPRVEALLQCGSSARAAGADVRTHPSGRCAL